MTESSLKPDGTVSLGADGTVGLNSFDVPETLPDDIDEVRALLERIDQRITALGGDSQGVAHQQAIGQLRRRFDERFQALSQAHEAAAALRRITTPRDLLLQAPGSLCEGTGLRRAMVSVIRESTLTTIAVQFDEDPDGAEDVLKELQAAPVRLDHQVIEADVLRRRRATLVTNVAANARADRRLAGLLHWQSYVAAPLLSGATVVGMIHADRGPSEPLDVVDREVLWEFASVLSQIYESAELRRTLRQEREDLRRFLEWLNARSVSLADAPITFAAYADGEERATPVIAAAEPIPGVAVRDDRLVFSGLLTRRELDVLRLLADGGTNKTIADALVLSDTTVKFHVNSILRKLHVANRAEAVARYLSLLAGGPQ